MSLNISPSEQSINSKIASYSEWPIDSESEISILELLPPVSHHPTEIHCNLTTAKLSDEPPYETLSYAWGDSVFSEKIYLPTGYLAITGNLAAALRQLRHHKRPRKLWIDAVCINQMDDNEKGHQVMLTAQVYSATRRCLAWLGSGNAQTDTAIGIIKDLASKAWRFGIPDSVVGPGLDFVSIGEGVQIALRDVADELEFEALSAFFSQGWFSRLWVVQEVCLPSEIAIWNGQVHSMSNNCFWQQSCLLSYQNLPRLGTSLLKDPVLLWKMHFYSVESV